MELIQMPSLCPDYHDLHLKSTTAIKIFTLMLSGSTSQGKAVKNFPCKDIYQYE
jgi:hypothetical protein